jgi:hypothetical protein
VNAATAPAGQLAVLLQDTADGMPADLAAIRLLIRHDYLLHRPAFRRIITAGSSARTGEPAAVIRWRAAIWALDHGLLPCSASEQAILQIAASLGDDDIGVHLRQVLAGLDRRDIALVTAALAAAHG